MALTLTPPPGTYTSAQTVTVTGPANVTGVIMTTDGSDPVLVRTVCSTNKFAPTEYPYIQTIEDGRGRAIFDGSFPKYFNALWTAQDPPPTSFAQLNGDFKLLYNALNFLRGTGTRILLLGDHYPGDGGASPGNYLVKDTVQGTSFYTSFTGIANLMGLTLTIKDASDYGGVIDITYAECMNYDVIFFMSSAYEQPAPLITPAAGANIAQARRDGVGIYICTDNSGDAPGTTTRVPEGFYASANVIVTAMTAANFQGNLDLSPGTTVGYNKVLNGNSPLFSGLADTDVMRASLSDSYVNQAETTPQPLPLTVNIGPGYTTLKFAVIDTSDNITFEQYGYNIGEPPLVELSDSAGNTITSWPETNLHGRDTYFKYVPSSSITGNGSGFVMVGTQVIGEFSDNGAGMITVSWLTTPYTPAGTNNIYMPGTQNGSVTVSLTLPVVFDFIFPFNRFVPTALPTDKDGSPFASQINRNEFAGNSLAQVLQKAISQLPVTPQPKDDKSRTLAAVYTRMTT